LEGCVEANAEVGELLDDFVLKKLGIELRIFGLGRNRRHDNRGDRCGSQRFPTDIEEGELDKVEVASFTTGAKAISVVPS
jgi:hypothetical protein